jgi:hypothetical protein
MDIITCSRRYLIEKIVEGSYSVPALKALREEFDLLEGDDAAWKSFLQDKKTSLKEIEKARGLSWGSRISRLTFYIARRRIYQVE